MEYHKVVFNTLIKIIEIKIKNKTDLTEYE